MRKIRQNKRWKKAVSVILAGAMLCSEGGIFSTVSRQNIPLMVYAQENSDTVITSLEYYDAANGATYEKSGTTDASFGFVMPKFNGKNSSELALPEVESDLELQVNVDGEWKNINEVEYFKFNSTWGWEYQDWGGWICWFNVQETTKLRFHGKTNDVNLEYTLNFTKLETKQLSSISATVTEKEADATGGSAIGWETIQFNGGADTYEQVKDDVCILVKREGESEFVSLLDNAESGWVYDQNFGIYTEGNGGLWFSGVESAFTIRLQSKNDEQVYTEVNINFLTPERSGFTLTAVDGKTIFDAKEAEDHKATVGICLPKIDGTNPLKTDLDLFVYEVCTGAVYDQTTGNWTGGEWKDLADVEASDWVYQANGYNNYSDQQQWGYWADYVYGLWFQPVKKDMYLRIGYPENGEKGGEVGDNYIYYTFLGDEEAVIPDVSDMTDIEVDKSDMEPEGDVKEIPDLEGWSLIFHDEFNGNELDETKWSYQTGYLLDENDINTFGWGNNELEHYTDSDKNSSVADGMLKITMLKESKTFTAENGSATATYSSAKIVSKDKFAVKYGRVDFRAKLPDGDGIWPALWMMPNDDVYGSWASSGEIDVFEGRGRTPEIAFGTLHYGGTWPANTSTGATLNMVTDGNKKSDMTDWHIYSLVWEEGKIKIYVDGKCFFKCTSDTWFSSGTSENKNAPFDQQFFLIMNLAAGGWFDQNVQPDEATFTSKEMYVDYVRVYQKPTDSAALDEDADGLYGTYRKNTEQSIGTTTELTEQLTSEELITEEKTTEQLTSEELTTEQLMGENTAETTTEQLTSEKITTEEKTTEQLTSEELTTEEKTTEQLTSEKITTEERTTEQLTSEKLTAEEKTTEQLTSEKKTTEEKTTEQLTSEKKTTEEKTTEQLTSEKLTAEEKTTEQLTSEKLTIEEKTTEQLTSERLTTEERTTEQLTSERLTTEERMTEQLTSEKIITEAKTTEQLTSEKATTEEKTTEQLTSEKITTEEKTTEQLTSEKITTEEKTTEQLTSEKLTTEERTTEQLTNEKLITEEKTTEQLTSEKKTTEERTTEQLTSEKATKEQLTSEKLTTEERTTERLTSERLTTEERTTERLTSERLTIEERTTEEKTTEQLTSERLTTEERTTEQLASEKLTTEEKMTEQLTSEKAITEEKTTEQLTSEKATTEEKTTTQVTTQEKCTHRYEIQSVVSSTCTTVGKVNMICSLCGERKVEEIPVTEHSYSSEWTIDKVATKTSTGSKSHHCKICGAKTDITVIPKCETTNVTKPAKVTKLTISTGKTKQLKVKWKKVSLASGYQLMYATDKKFKKGKKIITIGKKTRVSKTLKKLKKGKKYYVKVRAYKNVKGKKIYGSWSKIKVKKCK